VLGVYCLQLHIPHNITIDLIKIQLRDVLFGTDGFSPLVHGLCLLLFLWLDGLLALVHVEEGVGQFVAKD